MLIYYDTHNYHNKITHLLERDNRKIILLPYTLSYKMSSPELSYYSQLPYRIILVTVNGFTIPYTVYSACYLDKYFYILGIIYFIRLIVFLLFNKCLIG